VLQDVQNRARGSEQLFSSTFENAQLGISFFNLDGGGEDPWLAAAVLVPGDVGPMADRREA
jgi:hypothetical protein